MPTAEILVPFGTKYIAVEKIAGVIAGALFPDQLFDGISDPNKIDAILLRQATAEETHERLVRRHILAGRLATRNSSTMEVFPPVVFPSAVVLLEDFESYVRQFNISVAFDFVGISEILPPLATKLVDEWPVHWRKPGHNNDLRRDVAIALATVHLQHCVKEMARLGTIVPINGWPGDELMDDAQWGVSRRDAEQLRKLRRLDTPSSLWAQVNQKADEQEALHAQYARQDEAKRAAGRFTILEASNELERATGIEADRWQHSILEAVGSGNLPLRNPKNYGDRLPYPVPSDPRPYYDQIDAEGLNRWLDAHPEWSVSYRFGGAAPNWARQSDRADGPAAQLTQQTATNTEVNPPVAEPVRLKQFEQAGATVARESLNRSPDPALAIIQQAYNAILAETGKAPSQRKVAEKSGYARETVGSRWSQLKRVDQPK